MPPPDNTAAAWLDEMRKIEDLGFDAVSVSEHLSGGWRLEAMTAMAAIVAATTRLRVLSLVLANDFRNPVLVHKAAATIDFASDGRVELGLGAGWLERDYAAAGLAFESAGTRIERLEEAVTIIKGLFLAPTFSFAGRHYTVTEAEGLPRPTQLPHPPILIGGGGPKVLGVAARQADIIGVHARLDASAVGPEAASDLAEDAVAAKVGVVMEALRAAGRIPGAIELQLTIYHCRITDRPGDGSDQGSSFSRFLQADPEVALRSPAVLVGSLAACADRLQELRERFGFNVFKLSGRPDANAPIVSALAGR
ncbi:MAG: TIGR03621 family F420-dependent LLM class oxidoreductase [Chloroflexi bacterium]|nr:TIGR03621 family F420-dependent LLM class oxidoreductase [Chloroflexota bacterium]